MKIPENEYGVVLFNPKGVTHIEQWISEGTKAVPDAYRVRLENERTRIRHGW